MGSSSRAPALLIFTLLLLINILLLVSSSRFSHDSPSHSPILSLLGVQKKEPASSTSFDLGSLGYPLPELPDAPTDARKWALVPALLLYTVFLLAFLGICAGDFLVVNLATIADGLGMDQDVAGVTLLALGNGSPDVFSTYAAFTANSGSLAIGELLGAATFIISVVVGSMALVKPFQVHPGPFLRDVGFSIAAVSLLLFVIHDGRLEAWETLTLIGLYINYVLWIVVGTRILDWRSRRRKAVEEDGIVSESDRLLPETRTVISYSAVGPKEVSWNERSISTSEPDSPETPSHLRPPQILPPSSSNHPDHFSHVRPSLPSRYPSSSGHIPRRSRASSSASSLDVRRTTFSILGALDFRDVVNTLRAEGDDLSPTTPFSSGHYALPHHHFAQSFRSPSPDTRVRRRSSKSSHRSNKSVGHIPDDLDTPRGSPSVKTGPRLSPPRRQSDPSSKPSGRSSSPSSNQEEGKSSSHDVEYNPWSQLPVLGSGSSARTSTNGHDSSRGPKDEVASTPTLIPFPKAPHDDSLPPTPTTQPPIVFPTIHLAPPPDATGSSSTIAAPQLLLPPPPSQLSSKRARLLDISHQTYRILFPSLQSLSKKSYSSAALSIVFVPVVLVLTLTLPVVETATTEEVREFALFDDEDREEEERPDEQVGGEVEREDGETSTTEELDELVEVGFNKWLLAVQCLLGPTWAAAVLFWESDSLIPPIVLSSFGLLLSLFTLAFASDGTNRIGRLARCFLGFSVAMVWIMTFADEVVSVLSMLGKLFGLSDAIIGVTIFAIGNSTADLVANLSIASFAPIMAFSACFGGPMLNILLGVGFSGAFVTLTSGKPYPIRFSPTLFASAVGLLTLLLLTLIVVPLNGWMLTRKWGGFLVGFYFVSMTANVLTELFLEA